MKVEEINELPKGLLPKRCYFCGVLIPKQKDIVRASVIITTGLSCVHVNHAILCQKCLEEWSIEMESQRAQLREALPA